MLSEIIFLEFAMIASAVFAFSIKTVYKENVLLHRSDDIKLNMMQNGSRHESG